MKIKTVGILLLCMTSLNAVAYEGQGFKIIKESYTESPNFKGGIRDNATNKLYAPKFVSAHTYAYDAEGHPMEYAKVEADHNVSVNNITDKTQRYVFSYILSCESAFEHFDRTVDVYAHGSFIDRAHSWGAVQQSSTGTYGIHAMTKISGADDYVHTSDALLRIRN